MEIRWFIEKVILYLITIFIVFSLLFLLFHLMPGDPISLYFQTLAARYKVSTPNYQSIVEEYRKVFGLDKDLFTQYICFLRNVILNRDLGPSILAFPTILKYSYYRLSHGA